VGAFLQPIINLNYEKRKSTKYGIEPPESLSGALYDANINIISIIPIEIIEFI
jgi:hypothetical protein